MSKFKLLLATIAGLMGCTGALAGSIQVNGNLVDDWKITPTTWLTSKTHVQSTIEDQTGTGAYYLNPGWGGQAYDAEALYALIEGNTLFIALATGHNPETSNNPAANSYGAGDFAIDFGKDGRYEVGINIKPGWDTFGTAGGVYGNPTWALGLWDSSGHYTQSAADPSHPTSMTAGTSLGNAELVISTGKTGFGTKPSDTHYFYEIGLSLDLLRKAGWDGDAFNIHWTENCANDSIMVDPPSAVPEPGTLALLPLGLIGLAALRRRKSA